MKRIIYPISQFIIVLSFTLFPLASKADGKVKITWLVHNRPPLYLVNKDGSYGGTIVDIARKAFDKSGLNYKIETSATNRTMKNIVGGKKHYCGAGWFKNPKRESLARFSFPIYQDRSRVALVRTSLEPEYTSLRGILEDKNLRLGVKLGYSYGQITDNLIKEINPKKLETSQSGQGMLRMLLGGRFDYFLLSPDQADVLHKSTYGTKILQFNDAPPGSKRYILCSKSVPDFAIERLNAAIAELGLNSF